MDSLLETYSTLLSSGAIATGVIFGTARILCAVTIENQFSLVAATTMPASYFIIFLVFLRCIVVPFFEEALFRKNLDNPTFQQFIGNSITFGLVHGLLPGSLAERATRIGLSTIGGFFYCGARVVGGDVWSSALAHSMYNFRWLTELV